MARKTLIGRSVNFHCYWKLYSIAILTLIALQSVQSQPFAVDTLSWTGPADERINLVYFGDGYQADELDKYLDDVRKVNNHFFSQSPFKEYQSYFNIVAIQVPSEESGAKRMPGDSKNTYFQSTYGYADIERLLVAQQAFRAQEILFDQFPLYHQAVLIVNDDKYGGSGGWLATTSTHADAPEIALHEIGHSFAGLADEYWAGDSYAAERPNMTRTSDPKEVRWNNWIDFMDVNVYPHRENFIWYRPHQSCKMRVLNHDYCPVCMEAITKTIHDLANPIIDFEPEFQHVEIQDSMEFKVHTLKPQPNTMQEVWLLGGVPLDDALTQVIVHNADIPTDNTLLEVLVADSTNYVRDVEHQGSHTYRIEWSLSASSTVDVQYSSLAQDIDLFPNPVSNTLQILIPTPLKGPFKVSIMDISGIAINQLSSTSNELSIDVSNYTPGSYFLLLRSPNGSFLHSFVKE